MVDVKLPDGSIARFPDNMADKDIEAVLQKKYAQPSNETPKEPLGFIDSVGLGFKKGGVGLIQAATEGYEALGGDVNPSFRQATYDTVKDLNEQGEGNGIKGFLGELVGGAAAVPLPVAKVKGLMGLAGLGAAQGGAMGAVAPLEERQSRLTSTGVGLAGGAVLAPALSPVISAIGKPIDGVINKGIDAAYSVSDNVKSVANKFARAGDDLSNLSAAAVNLPNNANAYKTALIELGEDAIKSFSEGVKKGLPPREAYLAAKAEAEGITLTRGDLTQDPTLQRMEDQAFNGIFGERAQQVASDISKQNQTGMQNYAGKLEERITGTPSGSMRLNDTSVGNNVASSVKSAADLQKAKAVSLLNEGKKGKAFAPLDDVADISNKIKANLVADFPVENMNGVNARLKDMKVLQDLQKRNAGNVKTITKEISDPANLFLTTKTVTSQTAAPSIKIPYRRLDAMRQKIYNTPASTPQEQAALSRMYRLYSNELEDIVTKGILTGDENAIKTLREGQGLYREYKQAWFGKDGKAQLGKVIEKDLNDKQVADLFGSSIWGKSTTVSAVNQLKDNLGGDSDAMAQVRGLFLNRILKNNLNKENPSFGVAIKSSVEQFQSKNKELYDTLFTPQMQQELRDFANVSWQMNNKVKSKVNPSGSGVYMAGLATQSLRKLPWLGEAGVAFVNFAKNGGAEKRAVNSFLKPLQRVGSNSKIITDGLRALAQKSSPYIVGGAYGDASNQQQPAFYTPNNPNGISPQQEPLTLEITPQSYGTQYNTQPSPTQANEGRSLTVYNDTTGNRTIGDGFNFNSGIAKKVWKEAGVQTPFRDAYLGKSAITPQEAQALYQTSEKIARNDANDVFSGFNSYSPSAQAALVDLSYQYGKPSLQKNLKPFINYMNSGKINLALKALDNSDYAKKYSNRHAKVRQMLSR